MASNAKAPLPAPLREEREREVTKPALILPITNGKATGGYQDSGKSEGESTNGVQEVDVTVTVTNGGYKESISVLLRS